MALIEFSPGCKVGASRNCHQMGMIVGHLVAEIYEIMRWNDLTAHQSVKIQQIAVPPEKMRIS